MVKLQKMDDGGLEVRMGLPSKEDLEDSLSRLKISDLAYMDNAKYNPELVIRFAQLITDFYCAAINTYREIRSIIAEIPENFKNK